MNRLVDRRNTWCIARIAVFAALLARREPGGRAQARRPCVHDSRGFAIERIAGPPLVDRPITAAFDDVGRLYVADSSGSNDNVKKQLAEKPHRIIRLEDSDGDGKFDKKTIFADKMMFPEGTMWYGGSLYVAAPPSIWKLTDTDRRRCGRPAGRVVRGQDADRLRQRPAWPVPADPTAGFTGARGRLPSRPTNGRESRRLSRGRPTFSALDLMEAGSSRS